MPGTIVVEFFDSKVLRGNPLGDPHLRRIPVYLPPSYGRGSKRYPVIYFLTGFTGSGEMMQNRSPWSETLAERCDRLIASRKMAEAIVVMPDCFTRYGGSQYVNSSATGRYEDHVAKELVDYVDREYRTIPKPGARAVMGKSSGGYGAMILGMRHPETFGVVCCTSGDMYFLYCYLVDFPKAQDTYKKHGGCAGFIKYWERQPKRMEMSIFPAINTLAMASCYSPNPKSKLGFDLPIDEATGELREDVWRRWLEWDPVEIIGRYARNLKKLSLLFLDCGSRDEFNLHHGMRIFSRKAKELKVRHVVEEFDDNHMAIQYRYDRSLELASRAFRRG